MISEEIIVDAARRLTEAARSPARVILFGSHARGEAEADSDLDFLVVERELPDRFEETLRLRRALKPLRLPVDVIVVSENHVAEWGAVRNRMLHAALREGRVLARRDQRDLAALLVAKAAGHQAALGALASARDVPDEVFGFHAQQAVEKLIKAALASLGRDFPRTHDLGVLTALLEDAGHSLPEALISAEELTIWAVEFRYENSLERTLDRAEVVRLVAAVRDWVAGVIQDPGAG